MRLKVIKESMRNKIVNVEVKKEEYVIVPKSWFEQLIEISKKSRDDDKLGKQFLLGYISSAETILKYAKRTDSF
jgi:hypothetical protein